MSNNQLYSNLLLPANLLNYMNLTNKNKKKYFISIELGDLGA